MDDGADERRYLQDGYRVLSLNWRGDCREIDLGEERDGPLRGEAPLLGGIR